MKLTLRKHEEMLLALLRAALNEKKAEEEYFQNCTEEDWERCNQLSIEQGVMCLAWDGILTLPAELMPPRKLKLKWSVAVAMYEKQYELYCKTAAELTELYAQHGIATTVLKGVGMSTLYPKPEHREGGDIDIYTYSADRSKMSDQEANALADKLIEQKGIEIDHSHNPKHSVFVYNGITVENHRVFLSVRKLRIIDEIQEALRKYSITEKAELVGGKYRIYIPDRYFNTLYIPVHTGNHYDGGLKLHHLCDWTCILNHYGLQIPDEVQNRHFKKIISALTAFTNRYMGTDIERYDSDKECERTFNELFRNAERSKQEPSNPILRIAHKTKWLFHNARIRKRMFGEPIYQNVKEPITRNLCHPERILK